ncbi:phosphoribosyltransferase family protein [Plantactinospora siamensis]|uniref:Phosphoribosyltransferase family protein n=1 Tax=Plantactinospora siamensis TaxID=555372 RepID=A0ABV6NR43_9ACTN
MRLELRKRLIDEFRWVDPDPGSTHLISDVSGWWRDPDLLAALGPALAAAHRATRPTVVVAPEVTGLLLGPLAAVALGVGFVPAHKHRDGRTVAGPTTWARTPPDHRGRTLSLGVRDGRLGPGDRVLLVDDWVETGAQLTALYEAIRRRGAEPVGASAVVAGCPPELARSLNLTWLLHADDL